MYVSLVDMLVSVKFIVLNNYLIDFDQTSV